jgi:hypothetical protein
MSGSPKNNAANNDAPKITAKKKPAALPQRV